jgi:hypothetical protein
MFFFRESRVDVDELCARTGGVRGGAGVRVGEIMTADFLQVGAEGVNTEKP